MGIVQASDGNNYMAYPQVEGAGEGLLEPELLQFHFAAFFYFRLPFTRLGEFLFDGRSRSGMLELNLGLHRPSFPKVVSQIDNGVGYVKPSVGRVICVLRR